MPACTFFGHSQCPNLRNELQEVVTKLAGDGVDMLYVGDNGNFDAQVRSVLRELGLRYGVVLAYLPKGAGAGFDDTMFPEGLELVHPRYAIERRNLWMLERSDYVVTYVHHSWGGAAKFAALAERQGKRMIRL